MKTLLVDNYDSYTYNVFHLLAAVSGEEPKVVHNDMVSWKALSRGDFDAIVLSPGPGRPQRWHDFGVCADILRHSEVPVLGICLGHQGIGNLLSGMVGAAPMVMHGRLSRVYHDDSGLRVLDQAVLYVGPVLAAPPINFLSTYLQAYGEWSLVLFAAIVIVVMRSYPAGISGLIERAWRDGSDATRGQETVGAWKP